LLLLRQELLLLLRQELLRQELLRCYAYSLVIPLVRMQPGDIESCDIYISWGPSFCRPLGQQPAHAPACKDADRVHTRTDEISLQLWRLADDGLSAVTDIYQQ
jgi:hypothetical protein